VLEAWNRTDVEHPAHATVHALYEAQAARTPDAVAIVFGDAVLTYAALDRRANQLAHHLVARGVRPDTRVAICVERGMDLVVGVLGILKAGGAYVPLDPAYPAERLAFMVADAGAPVLLAHAALLERLPALAAEVVCMDRDADTIARESEASPGVEMTPEHLAYVIYTSGSVGRPKGTEVPHRAIPGFFRGADVVRYDEGTVLLQQASTSWDVLTLELWPAVLSGGRTVLYPAPASEPGMLGEQVRAHGVNTLWLTSAYFNLIVDSYPEVLAGVTQVMTGGEAVSATHVRRAMALYPNLRLTNGYGPSECTVFTSCYPIPADFDAATVPIGSPVGDRRVYLLDAHGEPVPIGAPGEMHVGGPAVGRGYLNQPRMTAERFVPDPFSPEPGARLYRTGDVARWRTDGTIEFVGRTDFQVKVRGFRIELGEIEARLGEHPALREAVVVARQDVPGDTRLVAYYVGGDTLDAQALRAHLAERLPEHTIPAAYVRLDALPLTPHGKVDRRALPAPDADAYATVGYEAPVGATEVAVAGIWAEVLGVERVGRWDSFFELGGHSLLAVQVLTRVEQLLGVHVPLPDLFTYTTVEALAARVEGSARTVSTERAIPVRAKGTERPLFLVPDGVGSVAYAQVLYRHVDAAIPVYSLPDASAPEPRPRTLEAMGARLARMIRAVQPEGPYRVAGWSFGGMLAYEVAVQLIGQDQAVEFVGMMDTSYMAGAAAAPDDASDGVDFADAADPVDSADPRVSVDSVDSADSADSVDSADDDAAGERETLLSVLGMIRGLDEDAAAALRDAVDSAPGADLETLVKLAHAVATLPSHITAPRIRIIRDQAQRKSAAGRALREYAPLPIPIPIHLFAAQDNPSADPLRGWGALLPAASIRVSPVPGTHWSMMEDGNVEPLGQAISRELAGLAGTAPAVVEDEHSPVVTLRFGSGGGPLLFCAPGAGASVTSFNDLAGAVDPTWAVQGLQPRGLDGELLPHSSVEAAAESCLRAVQALQPTGPVHLLGHSFGGWIVFEMAHRLRRAGREVGSLTIVDSEVPDEDGAPLAEYDGREAFLSLVEMFDLATEGRMEIGPREIEGMDAAGRMRLMHARLVRLGVMPRNSRPDILRGPFAAFSACLRAPYVPVGTWPEPLRLVLVRDPRMDEAANQRHFAEVVRGWKHLAPALRFTIGDGNHITALKPPHVRSLGALLTGDRTVLFGTI
ncbi:MAG TPA: amino acid adenylation domain-containing protein, partial [Longimicrobium sp.]|nr:amino acid adenylation domain-containing protein [Longimicrobium sp.]